MQNENKMTMENKKMKMLDLDYQIRFVGNNDDFVKKLTTRLDLPEIKSKYIYMREYHWIFKIHRSLHICLPIILTECEEYEVSMCRDDLQNAFEIQVRM